MPDNSVFKKIQILENLQRFDQRMAASSFPALFGYGFVDQQGDPEENQLICVVNRDKEISIVRKNVDKTIYDWPRSTKSQNRNYSITMFFGSRKSGLETDLPKQYFGESTTHEFD